MIYLIGGPPKCGKTTLAKKICKEFGIPWISTDTLQSVARAYLSFSEIKKRLPLSQANWKTNDEKYSKWSTKKIVHEYRTKGEGVNPAVEMFIESEIKDGNNFVIEGYHITPKLVNGLNKKFGKKNIRAVFLIKTDQNKMINDFKKSSTPNDWVLVRTKNKETFLKIAKMISEYSEYFKKEANTYGLKVFNSEINFKSALKKAMSYLILS